MDAAKASLLKSLNTPTFFDQLKDPWIQFGQPAIKIIQVMLLSAVANTAADPSASVFWSAPVLLLPIWFLIVRVSFFVKPPCNGTNERENNGCFWIDKSIYALIYSF